MAKALARHNGKLGKDSEKVKKWRPAPNWSRQFVPLALFPWGTNAVKGIVLDLPTQEELHISPSAFTHTRRLRLLIFLIAQISGGPICLPNNFRWLEWPEHPLPTLKLSAGPKNLFGFNVHNSRIRELGGNLKRFRNSKFQNFSRCKLLICIPDFTEVPNLETLNLSSCSYFMELPSKLKLKYLQTLDVSGCS